MIETRFEQDLKLLTTSQLNEKYGERDWTDYFLGIGPTLEPLKTQEFFPNEIALAEDVPQEPAELAIPPYKGRAFGKFVMIRRLEHEHTGRLVMPERISGTSDIGWVASIGEETEHIEKGMIVVFDQYAGVGREVRLLDENGLPGQFLLVEEADILAILEKV